MFDKQKNNIFKKLFIHNLNLNGKKAVFYPFGLTASRYFEYGMVLEWIKDYPKKTKILEGGCGHSILPAIWCFLGLDVVAIDRNKKALHWQKNKCGKISKKSCNLILADLRNLPFRNSAFTLINSISVIEHIPDDGDIMTIRELERILDYSGLITISFPISSNQETYFISDLSHGIPYPIKRLLGSSLNNFFTLFKIDRQNSYFERNYGKSDIYNRIVSPSKSMLADYFTLSSSSIIKALHGRIIPIGLISIIELLIAWNFMNINKSYTKKDAIMLKLVKH